MDNLAASPLLKPEIAEDPVTDMPLDVSRFVQEVQPSKTVLLFGAGSSIPSGAPSVPDLQTHFQATFGVSGTNYTLAEQTGIIEQKTKDRRRLIEALQSKFRALKPAGAILNLPLYDWKSIFTTNYDEIVEEAYKRRQRRLKVYSTNFDFGLGVDPLETDYFKLHGTISKDVSLGDHSRIIITQSDYDETEAYRDQLWDRLKADIGQAHLIVIGHSLADDDIRTVVNRTLSLKAKSGLHSRITLLLYTRDEGRAALFEARGVEVVFGGLDDFFAGLVGRLDPKPPATTSTDPLDQIVALRPATLDAAHAFFSQPSNVGGMYNGWPASFGDIAAGLTFRRRVAADIVDLFATTPSTIAILLGPSGVGKTTAARQALATMAQKGFHAWQHKEDQNLITSRWREMGRLLQKSERDGVLLIDNAHADLPQVNDLADQLDRDGSIRLRLILVSTNHNWNPRLKSPVLFKNANVLGLNRVAAEEIDALLDLVERNASLRALVESEFAGWSRPERRRRLTQRCEADMFVCLKNIFSSEKFDDIILREYADLGVTLQAIYKSVAAMESAGVHVHRQLVIRLLGLPAGRVSTVLGDLEDIIHEETVDEAKGIYAWRGRHKVIMGIVAEHKYYGADERYQLFERVVDSISPTYDIEIRTIRELCNVESGLATVSDLKKQNILLRKMISTAPGERVPRHRLVRNLLELGHYDAAETEIKVFGHDFKMDAPTTRYRIDLAAARAVRGKGLMREDRIVLIKKAEEIAAQAARRFRTSKAVLGAYCEVGIETAKLTGDGAVFDAAMEYLKTAEDVVGDPEISRAIQRYTRRMANIQVEPVEPEIGEPVDY